MTHSPILTPADHDHFIEHGFVVVKNVADPAHMREAIAGFEGGTYSGTVGGADYRPVRPDGLRRCYGPRFAAALSELMGEAHVISPHFVGDDMPRKQEPEKVAAWKLDAAHTDDDYPTPAPAAWAIGSFLFLTPVKPRGGAFIYFANSYRRYRARMTRTPWALKVEASDPAYSGPPAEFLAEPGDLLLFHHLCGHTGSVNVSDPTTRHALLSRHHPAQRVVPGHKSFEQMSTIEKANSVRYLRHRFGDDFVTPKFTVNAASDRALKSGFAGASGKLIAAATYHFGGVVWIFYVQSDAPSRIRVCCGDDFVNWREHPSIETGLSSVESLSFFQRQKTVFLSAGGPDAAAVFASDDFKDWRLIQNLSGISEICGHYTTAFGSKVAEGFVAFMRKSGANVVTARWAKSFPESLAASQDLVACEWPSGVAPTRFITAPTFGEGMFAMVLETNSPEHPLWVTRGRDSVKFSAAPVPLAHDCVSPPRHLRVYHRARDYWIVTFIRAESGADRMFWGVIDWAASPVELKEIREASSMLGAMEVVGLF